MICKRLAITLLFGLLPLTTFAQQKPDFSGTWKLNVAKSEFGNLPGPESRTDVVTHKEPSITVNVTAEGGQMGKRQYTANYLTDGKETTYKVGERETKATAKWEGNNLVINSKFQYEGTDVSAVITWSLAADGKTLTINPHFSSPMGDAEQKLVFEKQESGAAAPATKP